MHKLIFIQYFFGISSFGESRLIYLHEGDPKSAKQSEMPASPREGILGRIRDAREAAEYHSASLEEIRDEAKQREEEFGDALAIHYKAIERYHEAAIQYFNMLADLGDANLNRDRDLWNQLHEQIRVLRLELKNDLFPRFKQAQLKVTEYIVARLRQRERGSDLMDEAYLGALSKALENDENAADDLREQLLSPSNPDVDLSPGWDRSTSIETNINGALAEHHHQIMIVEKLENEGKEFVSKYGEGHDGEFYRFAIEFHGRLAEYRHELFLRHSAVKARDRDGWTLHNDRAEEILAKLIEDEPEYYFKRDLLKRFLEEIKKPVKFSGRDEIV